MLKVKRVVKSQDYLFGGLKIVDVDFFLSSQWNILGLKTNKKKKKQQTIINKILDFADAFIADILIPKQNYFFVFCFTSWLYVIKYTGNEIYVKKQFIISQYGLILI